MKAPLDRQGFTLESVELATRRLGLTTPLATAVGTIDHREITLLRVAVSRNDRVQTGFGEASPLPGWSSETGLSIRRAVAAIECPLALSDIGELDRAIPGLNDLPVLRFGIESALCDALSRLSGLALGQALAGIRRVRPASCVPVQFTLGAGTATRCIQALAEARAAGHTHAKLKVGVTSPERDIERVRRIMVACPDLTLRLDANGAWSVEEALHVLASLPPDRIEMIEQPVPDASLDELLSRYGGGGPLIAADESCAGPGRIRALIRRGGLSGGLGAIVVKPSVVGGLLAAGMLFEMAQRHGVRVIISNLMESAVGRHAVAHLAAAYPELKGPHGLATGQWFDEDVAPGPDRIERARLQLAPTAGIGFEPVWPDRQ